MSFLEVPNGAERVLRLCTVASRASTEQLLAQVDLVLTEYVDHLPLTLRQISYRLVGAYGYEKTELAYERLANTSIVLAVPGAFRMDVIRDDGGPSSRLRAGRPAEES